MLILPDHFCELLHRIEPEEGRANTARDIPAQVRDFLKGHQDITTITPHSRLAGSYARCTAIKHIKDVDVLLLIDAAYRQEVPAHVLETLFQMLKELPEALDDEGEVVVRRHQRRSINIHLEGADFDLDIVPALVPDTLEKPLLIPDKDWNQWVETDPLGYGQRLSDLNSDCQDKVIPLIKLLKHWRDVQMCYRRPKSYWLECLVFHHISSEAIETAGQSYAELFHHVLASIYDQFLPYLDMPGQIPSIADPMLGHNVAHNWERSAFESFMRRVKESKTWAEKALAEEGEADAAQYWQKVFGAEWFPEDATEERVKRLSTAMAAGTLFVSSVGRVLTERPTSHAVQPHPQRFYGDQ